MSAQLAVPVPVVDVPFARSRTHATAVEGTLSSNEMIRKRHSDVEEFLDEKGREWARMMYEEHVALRASVEKPVEVMGTDGVKRVSARDSERHLETIFGRVLVPRLSYQAPGSADLHPMDAALNLPREMFSHGIRRMVAKEAARASFDEVVEIVRDYTGSSIGKRHVEELAVRAAVDFDAFYEHRAASRDGGEDLLVISTDGKGVVMRHEDLREGTRKAAEKSVRKLETRLTPGEKSNRKRMAQVATTYSIAHFPRTPADILHTLRDADEVSAKRPRPTDKRVWASVEKSSRAVIREAFADALRRDPDKRRRWVVLVDGDPKQLRAVKAEARRGGDVARTIRWWAARRKNDDDSEQALRAIDTTCDYLADRTRTRLMHYKEALRDGLPIATGVIEGACRYLVKDRMDRTGARWSLTGAEAVLRLRAVRASGDFDAYWQFHLARDHQRNHASHYEGGNVPDPIPAPKPRLRRVK
jgi:hypothetical protein